MITSPYNFVPLREAVFYPDWGSKVQLDKPFHDGVSGELEITVTATRPIYTRNQAPKPVTDLNTDKPLLPFFNKDQRLMPDDWKAFDDWISFAKNSDGKFELPGTLIHGAIKNLLRIASFGSIRDAASTDRYAVRDLNLRDYQQSFVSGTRNTAIRFLSRTGWLIKKGDEWNIYPCAHHRVEQSDLCGSTMPPNKLTLGDFHATSTAPNSVKAKYDLWQTKGGMSTVIRFTPCLETNQFAAGRHQESRLPLVYRLATSIGAGAATGRLVFTGQPSGRKHMEFIFDDPAAAVKGAGIPLEEAEQVARFLFAHQESEVLEYWKGDLNAGNPIPVFYLDDGIGGVRDFGLAQMFRLPATKTLKHGIPDEHMSPSAHDFADLIFGSIDGQALRGRAALAAFTANGKPSPMSTGWTILGEPRPSFYPNYLEQDVSQSPSGDHLPVIGRNKRGEPIYAQPSSLISTADIRLRGWKRYAVWPDWRINPAGIPEQHPQVSEENIKSATAFQPLPAGTSFTGKLRFHNLKLAELGALVWAIEWGGETNLRHSLGMAKGLGFGSAIMSIENRDQWAAKTFGGKAVTLQAAVDAFTSLMTTEIPGWNTSDELKELMLLADPDACPDLSMLEYPRLRIGQPNGDDFRNAKKSGRVLPRYSRVERTTQRVPPCGPTAIAGTTPQCLADLKIGDILDGTVLAQGRTASFVYIDFGFKGTHQDGQLHISQVSSSYVEDLNSELPSGKRVRVKIINKGTVKGRLRVDCSMKNVPKFC